MLYGYDIGKLADEVTKWKDKLRTQLLKRRITHIFLKENRIVIAADITLTKEEKKEYTRVAFNEVLRLNRVPWDIIGKIKSAVGKELNQRKLARQEQTDAFFQSTNKEPIETPIRHIGEFLAKEKAPSMSIDDAIDLGFAYRDEDGNIIINKDEI